MKTNSSLIIFIHGAGILPAQQEEPDGKYWSFSFQKAGAIYSQNNGICDRNVEEQIKKCGLIGVEALFNGAFNIKTVCFSGGALREMRICMMHIILFKFNDAHGTIVKIKVFFVREVPGDGGIPKALPLKESDNVQIDIFNWDQTVGLIHPWPVKLPAQVKDAGASSDKQL